MKSFIHIAAISITVISALTAQYRHENVFPASSGAALLQQLRDEYKTSVVLDYSVVRDTLFFAVDRRQDSLECIYTGMRLPLPAGQDPTEAVYLGGLPNGINTEHAYPQSKGAMGIAQSDMYNLYPSRIKTNSDRGDYPMGNIADNTVRTWYLGTQERATPPTVNRDLWSELVIGRFEPRESVKGNIARSIFYFYTMYRDQSNAADPAYFSSMMADLCQWHYDDPADSLEWNRNEKISKYQGGIKNPFILDCSLVSRAYCNNIDQACEALILSSTRQYDSQPGRLTVMPNPVHGTCFIQLPQGPCSSFRIEVLDMTGTRTLNMTGACTDQPGLAEVDLTGHAPGLYLIILSLGDRSAVSYARIINR